MTAASAYPSGSDQGPSEGRASEPSMEDILASIRRIIADDQQANGSRLGGRRTQPANAAAAPVAPSRPPAAPDREEPLDLARFVPVGSDPAHADHGHAAGAIREPSRVGESDASVAGIGFAAHAQEQPAPVSAPEHFDPYDSYEEPREVSLLASPMSESVMSAFEALAATVVLENKPMLEGILRDLLRPMLKTWLDDNLPVLVERLVRVEIERVARGSRG